MSKDYVKTAKPKPRAKPAARGSNARNKANATKAKKPWLLMVLCILVCSLFIGFLHYLNKQPAVSTEPVAQKEAAKKEAAKKEQAKKDELPAKPTKEPYQYIKELENKEVVVDVAVQKNTGGPFQMQCGSFRQSQQAESLKAQIAFAGFSSTVRRTEGSNGVWYRVVLGPYESKRKATADMNRLRQQNINTCRISNWA